MWNLVLKVFSDAAPWAFVVLLLLIVSALLVVIGVLFLMYCLQKYTTTDLEDKNQTLEREIKRRDEKIRVLDEERKYWKKQEILGLGVLKQGH